MTASRMPPPYLLWTVSVQEKSEILTMFAKCPKPNKKPRRSAWKNQQNLQINKLIYSIYLLGVHEFRCCSIFSSFSLLQQLLLRSSCCRNSPFVCTYHANNFVRQNTLVQQKCNRKSCSEVASYCIFSKLQNQKKKLQKVPIGNQVRDAPPIPYIHLSVHPWWLKKRST